jgi:hypothetical protein
VRAISAFETTQMLAVNTLGGAERQADPVEA